MGQEEVDLQTFNPESKKIGSRWLVEYREDDQGVRLCDMPFEIKVLEYSKSKTYVKIGYGHAMSEWFHLTQAPTRYKVIEQLDWN